MTEKRKKVSQRKEIVRIQQGLNRLKENEKEAGKERGEEERNWTQIMKKVINTTKYNRKGRKNGETHAKKREEIKKRR